MVSTSYTADRAAADIARTARELLAVIRAAAGGHSAGYGIRYAAGHLHTEAHRLELRWAGPRPPVDPDELAAALPRYLPADLLTLATTHPTGGAGIDHPEA
ncbi:hypothetical protein [Nocardia wallacei]|uniref:hypothetical protein n=1 Tax=Nocardia wallacei TaxID=480035 RepID=UPI002454CD25|nr:hypothetical protein [Nocardia wallacei]